MSLNNEKEVYNKVKVSSKTCEIEAFDHTIFPDLIRKRELEMIFKLLEEQKPEHILDYGCGGGWLSKILISEGYNVTGIDISDALIKNASELIPGGNFYAGDCLNLPFADNSFDFVIGIAILHHLNLELALKELKRVTQKDSTLFFIEPNIFNPISAVGNKIHALDSHTDEEKPFNPLKLKEKMVEWFEVREMFYLFPYSFGLSYISNKMPVNWGITRLLLPFIEGSEKLFESIPLLNLSCSQIAIILNP